MADEDVLADASEDEGDADRPLLPRQRAFVNEYIIDLNARQAAIRAGYSEAGATQQASRLLTYANIQRAVEAAKAQRLSRVNMTADTVLHELSLLAQSSLDHYLVDDNGRVVLAPGAPEGAMRAVQSMKHRKIVKESRDGTLTITYEVDLKLWDKPTPLKLMGKQAGLKLDSIALTGPNGGPIETVTQVVHEIVK